MATLPTSDEDLRQQQAQFRANADKNALNMSLHSASMANPAEESEILRLADKHQVPRDTVRRNLQAMRRKDKLAGIDVEAIRTEAPKLATWMQDPANAALAIDDINTLMQIEREASQEQANFWVNASKGTLERVNTLTGNLIEFAGRAMTAGGELTESVIGERATSVLRDVSPEVDPAGAITDVGAAVSDMSSGYVPQFTWEKFKGELTAKSLAGFIVEQGFQSLPDMAAAIYALPAYVASRTEEIAEVRAGEEAPQTEDLLAAAVPAVVSSFLERIGAVSVFRPGTATTYGQAAKEIGRAAGAESTTEFLQSGVEYLGEELGTGRPLSLYEMLDQQLAGFVAGGGIGAGMRTPISLAQATAARGQRKIVEDTIKRMDSAQQQDTFDRMLDAAEDVSLRQNAPDRFEQLMQQAADKSVHVPIETIDAMQADGVILPFEVTDDMRAGGSDLSIPMAWFLRNPDIARQYRNGLRMKEDGYSRDEIDEGGAENARKIIQQASKRAELQTESQRIYEEVKDQIVATGMQSEQTARMSAQLVPAYVATIAADRGIPVAEVYETMGLTIQKGAPVADTEADAVPDIEAEGIMLQEERIIEETGETVTIEQDAQQVYDRMKKRRNVLEKLRGCAGA